MVALRYVGVDVGTGSARAGVFDEEGKLLGLGTSPLQIWKEGDFVEQSSTDIWHAVCAAVKIACQAADVTSGDICGIGFAATCSLVALGADDSPVTVSLTGDARRNVIVWMDHRATDQAERINAMHSPVLQFVGGVLSPEMQPPKLLWVKENLKESWAVAFRWMDLSDWLTYRASGDDTRSLCTVVCKWTYLGHAHMEQMTSKDSTATAACGWDDVFWQEVGLEDLVEGNYAKIGRSVAFPGHPLGSGLTATAAKELGLLEGTPVGAALIDAHAGGVGVMEGVPPSLEAEGLDDPLRSRMVLVSGTSTCHMAVSKKKIFIPGVWGPYWSAMLPEYWLTEGGQSATGALLEYIIENHAAAPIVANRAASQKISIFELLNKLLGTFGDNSVPFRSALTKNLHVYPDFHGNRSPLADPKSRGTICGLSLSSSEKDLALLYLATVQSIAYGTRHIIEHCNAHGHKEIQVGVASKGVTRDGHVVTAKRKWESHHGLQIETLIACGGLSKNEVFVQEHADITGCKIILPREKETVLLGAAILGAVASKQFESVQHAMKVLNASGLVVEPSTDERVQKYHDAKYNIYHSLYKEQVTFRDAMASIFS